MFPILCPDQAPDACKICLVVLMGLPGAGKTSLCKQIMKELNCNQYYKTYMVEFDDILVQINNENCYKELRRRAYASAEHIIESINSLQNEQNKYVIFIDDNMYYKSMRYEYYKLAREYKISFLQIYIDVIVETAKSRNNKREPKYQVPESVILDMARKFEIPGKEQWESNLFILHTDYEFSTRVFDEFVKELNKCFDEPVLKQTDAKTGTLLQSRLQNIDLLLRKVVHSRLAADKTQAALYISKRKEIYKAIKRGEIIIDEKLSSSEVYSYLENLF